MSRRGEIIQPLDKNYVNYIIDYTICIVFFYRINTPDASIGVQCSMFRTVCSHKVVAVGFNTLRYDANVGVLNPPHE
ncbi:hypothetical protein [Treponema denticola]|nr:hypothetical protein [Treponema denticola]